MRKLLFLALLVAVAVAYFRRGSRDVVEPTEYRPAAAFAEGPSAAEDVPVKPSQPGTAPGPEVREQESQATQETRVERLTERDAEERTEAAERAQDDPLTEKLESGSENS
jgi:hypothetical protein